MNNFSKLSLAFALTAATFTISTIAAKAEMAYPEKCKADKMDMSNMDMSGGKMAMGDMTDYQKDAMDGMKAMDANMQQGMMKKGADVSFICGMIAHHMGAINMSQVELKYGKDEWSKKMAQSIIEAQEKEITEMTGWLEKQSK